jgi:hypothetical protein
MTDAAAAGAGADAVEMADAGADAEEQVTETGVDLEEQMTEAGDAATQKALEAKQAKALAAYQKQLAQTRAWKQNHKAAVKQHSRTCYVKQKEERMQKQRDYRLLQKELREGARASATPAAGAAARASAAPVARAYTFTVAAGCVGECTPGCCAACYAAIWEKRHPVMMRIQMAYKIQDETEEPLPVDAAEEARFAEALTRTWCKAGCEYLETKEFCKFWGECRRCGAVRKKARAEERRFHEHCAERRLAIRESEQRVSDEWQNWVASFKLGPEAGAAWRAEWEQALAEATEARQASTRKAWPRRAPHQQHTQ